MTLHYSRVVPLVASLLLLPGLASAQAVGSNFVSVSSNPSANSYAAGTMNAVLGTVTLTATQPGSYQIASLPLTLATTGSGTAANLSSCELVNNGGTVLNTNGNNLSVVSAGTNTVTFDTPLTVTQGSPITLTVECNLSSSTPFGSTFSFSSGSPLLASTLSASMTVFPSVTPGEVNAPLAAITLNPSTSSANVNITSLPFTATYSNGLTASDLSNCHIDLSGSSLDVNANGLLNGGANTLTLDSPLSATGGGSAIPLVYSCTVSSAAPIGGMVALSLTPSGIMTSNATTGAVVTPVQAVDPSTGSAESLGGTTTVVTPGTTRTGTTVTAPNTGAGASAPMTIILLLATAALTLVGLIGLQKAFRTD